MTTKLFHHKSKDNTIDSTAITAINGTELSNEQLKQIYGGYIINSPQGKLNWQKRQYYQYTHPGVAIPF